MDIMHWDCIEYSDFPLCSRLLFLQQKLASIVELNDPSQTYKFKLVDYRPCSTANFLECIYGKHLLPFINTSEIEKANGFWTLDINKEALL